MRTGPWGQMREEGLAILTQAEDLWSVRYQHTVGREVAAAGLILVVDGHPCYGVAPCSAGGLSRRQGGARDVPADCPLERRAERVAEQPVGEHRTVDLSGHLPASTRSQLCPPAVLEATHGLPTILVPSA